MMAVTALLAIAVQDLDNFVLPTGVKTVETGTLGRASKHGTGPIDVVVIAGAPFASEEFAPFFTRNGSAYTFHALTPAGYGGTNPPAMPTASWDDPVWTDGFLKAVEAYVDKNGLKRPILLGHHLMSDVYIALLAARRPEAYRGLALVCGSTGFSFGSRHRADAAMRANIVKNGYAPFYKTVSQTTWNTGTFQADLLSTDPARGKSLYDKEIAVPISVQLRYFLEYICLEPTTQYLKIKVPILAIDTPHRTFERSYDSAMRFNRLTLDEQKAKEQTESYFVQGFGSIEAAKREIETVPWSRVQDLLPQLKVQMLSKPSLFPFLDEPDAFDKVFNEFAKSLK
jgi:pimeloyl-ACP methyl ester carboxylesterase